MKTIRRLCALLLCALLTLGMTSAAFAAQTTSPADIAQEFKRLLNADGMMYQDAGTDADGNYELVVLYPGNNISYHMVTVVILRDGKGFTASEQEIVSFEPNQLTDVMMNINKVHQQFGHVLFIANTSSNTVSAEVSGVLCGSADIAAQILHDAFESLPLVTDAALPVLTSGQTVTVVTPTPDAGMNTGAPDLFPRNLTFGDTVTFGAWEQDGDTSNGPEPMEWRVLTVINDRALLITKKGVDVQVFNPQPASWTVWETCSLRAWLNGEFLATAFSDQERSAILATDVGETVNEKYYTSSGNPTVDRVFILSVQEMEAFFGGELDRTAYPTAYSAEKNGWSTVGYGITWTRTMGEDQYHVALIGELGEINYEGVWVHNEDALVRPAVWVTIG